MCSRETSMRRASNAMNDASSTAAGAVPVRSPQSDEDDLIAHESEIAQPQVTVDEGLLTLVQLLGQQSGTVGDREDGGGDVAGDELGECLPAASHRLAQWVISVSL